MILFEQSKYKLYCHKNSSIALVFSRSLSFELLFLLFRLDLRLSPCFHFYHIRAVFLQELSHFPQDKLLYGGEGTQCSPPSGDRTCRDCPSPSTPISKREQGLPYNSQSSSKTCSIFLPFRENRNHSTFCLIVEKSTMGDIASQRLFQQFSRAEIAGTTGIPNFHF